MAVVTGRTVRAACKMLGLPVVKVQKVSFQDLARLDAYFVSFSEPGEYKEALRKVSTELGVRVLEQPTN